MGHGQETKKPETCACNGDLYWQDGYGCLHCEACQPPPTTSLVVRRYLLAAGEWYVERRPGSGDFVAVENPEQVAAELPAAPSLPPGTTSPGGNPISTAGSTGNAWRRFCSDCYLPPDLWREVASPKYHDRMRVECKVCGKYIGYRLKSET